MAERRGSSSAGQPWQQVSELSMTEETHTLTHSHTHTHTLTRTHTYTHSLTDLLGPSQQSSMSSSAEMLALMLSRRSNTLPIRSDEYEVESYM